ncbi:GNAT family N-acetyltransferase [Pseudomonas sp. Marseille-P9899]|uniref:GNAT family N-acetyltransferase n=1 Tax=Pseudomonas sp. Marseille-P9899 TaxID=2730401 RepID=UPI00158D25AF|nr:GNAT family N-acetyltransferase [Pseudomonas sp. Marseille-P9899]
MQIIECTLEQLNDVATLFNQYRIFYELPDDLETSRDFLRANLENNRSRIFLLLDDDGQTVAFAQLYPALCSLAMKRFYWLYDLFVAPQARKSGHARQLMNHLTTLLTAEGADRISLDTATSNKAAQALYESLGYQREGMFLTYHKYLGT